MDADIKTMHVQDQATANHGGPSTPLKRSSQVIITPDQKEGMKHNREEALLKRQQRRELGPQSSVKQSLLSDLNLTKQGKQPNDKATDSKSKAFITSCCCDSCAHREPKRKKASSTKQPMVTRTIRQRPCTGQSTPTDHDTPPTNDLHE